jgi:hypothetical protein
MEEPGRLISAAGVPAALRFRPWAPIGIWRWWPGLVRWTPGRRTSGWLVAVACPMAFVSASVSVVDGGRLIRLLFCQEFPFSSLTYLKAFSLMELFVQQRETIHFVEC